MTISTSSKLALIFGAVMLVWGSVNAARASEKITLKQFVAMAPAFQPVYVYPCGDYPGDVKRHNVCVDGFASGQGFTVKAEMTEGNPVIGCYRQDTTELPCAEVSGLASGI